MRSIATVLIIKLGTLFNFLQFQDSASRYYHPCILVHGNHATGKSSLVKNLLVVAKNMNHVIANCTTLYSHKLLVEHILNTLYGKTCFRIFFSMPLVINTVIDSKIHFYHFFVLHLFKLNK